MHKNIDQPTTSLALMIRYRSTKQLKLSEFKTPFDRELDESNRRVRMSYSIPWDAFHEGLDVQRQLEMYRRRYGYYPEVVIGDPLYGTRDNREEIHKEKQRRREEYRQCIPIEGKFGQGKNGYNLNYIRAKSQKTSEAWIRSIFLVMILMVLIKNFVLVFFGANYGRLTAQISRPGSRVSWQAFLPAFCARKLLCSF